jgi:hypothetical protein
MADTDFNDIVARIRMTARETDISPRRRFAIRWRKPSLPRMVVAYPAFFVLKDDACDGETTRLLWERKAR